MFPPYAHQDKIFKKTCNLKRYALFWEMGTGKSKTLIDTIVYLFLNKEIDGILIVSDKGAYLNWEYKELLAHIQTDVLAVTRMAHWSSSNKTIERKKIAEILTAKDDTLDILLVNIEALSGNGAMETCMTFLNAHYSMMIIDEATSIKNPKAKRTINAQILGTMSEYRRIATGTPITQGPLDIYSQSQFLEPGLLGCGSFTAFKSRYAIEKEVILGTRRFKTIVGYQNLEDLQKRIEPWSSRILKSECLDLPPKVYETEYVEMTPQQESAYLQLKNQALLLINEGMLTSTNAMTTMEKLHQICCGHVADDDNVRHDIPHNRIETLLNLVDRVDGKIIIWCQYARDVENVMTALRTHWLKEAYFPVSYYGKTTQEQRLQNLDWFSSNSRCRALVGTAATGGKGLTLVNSAFVVYYSCGWKLESRLQSEDRNHRIGQTKSVTYIDLICAGTVEVKILEALRAKKDLADMLLDNNRLKSLFTD